MNLLVEKNTVHSGIFSTADFLGVDFYTPDYRDTILGLIDL